MLMIIIIGSFQSLTVETRVDSSKALGDQQPHSVLAGELTFRGRWRSGWRILQPDAAESAGTRRPSEGWNSRPHLEEKKEVNRGKENKVMTAKMIFYPTGWNDIWVNLKNKAGW